MISLSVNILITRGMGMDFIFLRQVDIILGFGRMMFFMGMVLHITLKEIFRIKESGKMGNLKNEIIFNITCLI